MINFETKWYKVETVDNYTRIIHKNTWNNRPFAGVVILPIINDKILLLEVFRYGTNRLELEFPRGCSEPNQSPEFNAVRELEEETGYSCEEMVLLAKYFQDSGCSAAHNHCFLALNCYKSTDQHLDKDEFVKFFECTFEEALELIDLGYINGANPIIAFEKAKNYLKR